MDQFKYYVGNVVEKVKRFSNRRSQPTPTQYDADGNFKSPHQEDIDNNKFRHKEPRKLSVEEEQLIGRHNNADGFLAEFNKVHGVVDVFGPYTIQLQDRRRKRRVSMPKWLKHKKIKPNTYQKGPRGGMYYYVSKDEVYLMKS